MFCTRCGSPNPNDASTCSNCSAPLVRRTSQVPPRATSPSATDPASSEYAPTRRYHDPSRPPASNPSSGYGDPGYGGQPQPPGYQPYQGYQSTYAGYTPPLPQSASGRALTAMILSIVSMFTCGPFLSIPGMIMGKAEMNAIREGQAPPAGEAFAKVGFYLGLVLNVIFGLGILLVILFVLLRGIID
jgi:ribosomal protein L40E